MLIDSHCHINAEEFALDREEVVLRARQAGVEYILDVCDDIADTLRVVEFCKRHEKIYTTVGVHPEIAGKYADLSYLQLEKLAQNKYVVGIGECGLDYYYNSNTKDIQIKVLNEHIIAAQNTGLPLIIHNRDADDDMMEILFSAYKKKPFGGELHCFSSSEKLCDFALSIGFYISASGIITFKKSENLRTIFAKVPFERLLFETDSPFLAPEPYRGKRNEPAYVVNTANALAKIKGVSVEDITKFCLENFLRLFNKISK